MAEWVFMVHPKLGDDQKPGRVTKEAFELVHKPAGWKLVPKKKTAKKGDK